LSRRSARILVVGNWATRFAISQRLREIPSVQLRGDLRLNTGVRYSGV